jgi:ABC-type branched-subunit amino acid transport system ATPase component
VVAERGIGILLVEHDMALVRQVCDHVWVLDFGELIFDGPAETMLQSEIVKAAYLGSESAVPQSAGDTDRQQEATTGTTLQ